MGRVKEEEADSCSCCCCWLPLLLLLPPLAVALRSWEGFTAAGLVMPGGCGCKRAGGDGQLNLEHWYGEAGMLQVFKRSQHVFPSILRLWVNQI